MPAPAPDGPPPQGPSQAPGGCGAPGWVGAPRGSLTPGPGSQHSSPAERWGQSQPTGGVRKMGK